MTMNRLEREVRGSRLSGQKRSSKVRGGGSSSNGSGCGSKYLVDDTNQRQAYGRN